MQRAEWQVPWAPGMAETYFYSSRDSTYAARPMLNVRCAIVGLAALSVWAAAARAADASLPAAHDSSNAVLAAEADAPFWCDARRWSFQAGVGFITGSTVDEVVTARSKLATGEGGGQIFLAQASYKLARLDPVLFGHPVKLDLELPLVLGVVNEHSDDPFMQYSGGFTLRWKTFPWNKRLYTNLETGVGLTYSAQVLQTERDRHPGRERSHLEFYWPIQIMLAHPRHREHQLVLFLHHHSGGTIFHTGGANTLGIAYRYVFEERSTR